MTYSRPTLDTLVRRVQSDIETRLSGVDAALRFSVENALSHAVGGAAHATHGHLYYLSRQLLPDRAEGAMARRWADILGITPKKATKASGEDSLAITGTDTSVCPDGTEWQRGDGAIFVQDGDATISGTSATASLIAKEAGTDGNTAAGVAMTLANPVSGISSSATVTGDGVTNGTDAESSAELLSRILYRLRYPPRGGGPGDYVRWALEVPGVTRAWEYPQELGLGTVTVRFVVDNDPTSIFPNAAKVTEVSDWIISKAPVQTTGHITVVAPVAEALDPTIALTPNTSAVQAAVEAELEDYLLQVGDPGGMTLIWSQLNEAISRASGETDHALSVPAADKVHTVGQLPTLGTITWS